MGEQTSPKIQIRCSILEYLMENRKPFALNSLADELIENSKIEETDRTIAGEILDEFYGQGILVPVIMPETSELVLVFHFDTDEEIIHYLKENGGREAIGNIVECMYSERALDEYEVKATILDLITDKTLLYDSVTNEVFIPTIS